MNIRHKITGTDDDEERRKAKFWNETIHFVIHDPPPPPPPAEQDASNADANAATTNAAATATATATTTSWKVSRIRLTPEFIQHRIDKAMGGQKGVSMSYLKLDDGASGGSGGEIILSSQMRQLCKPIPHTYRIVLSYPSVTKDIGGGTSLSSSLSSSTSTSTSSSTNQRPYDYTGQAKFVIRHVPHTSQNHLHNVTSHHVKTWLKNAILTEEKEYTKLSEGLTTLHEQLNQIDISIQQIATDPIVNELNGTVIYGPKADVERERKYASALEEKNRLRVERDTLMESLDALRRLKMEMMVVDVVPSSSSSSLEEEGGDEDKDEDEDEDEDEEDKYWIVEFGGKHKKYFEHTVLQKTDWKTTLMYAYPNHDDDNGDDGNDDDNVHQEHRPHQYEYEHDDHDDEDGDDDEQETNPTSGNQAEYIVDTSRISVERVEHGFGCMFRRRRPHPRDGGNKKDNNMMHRGTGTIMLLSQPLSPDDECHRHVDCYRGTYDSGKRHGYGILYTPSYIYSGPFDKDLQVGGGGGGGGHSHTHSHEDQDDDDHGKLMYCTGDVMECAFQAPKAGSALRVTAKAVATHSRHSSTKRMGGTDRYRRGLPNSSHGIITFADGSYFQGEIRNHELVSGIYVHENGECHQGEFENGFLVKGIMERPNGDRLCGEFLHCKLHGRGTYESKAKRSIYNGNFIYGEKHGFGEETFYSKYSSSGSGKKGGKVLAQFHGFFRNGHRTGMGTFYFQDAGFTSSRSGTRSERQKDDCKVFGPWLAGNPTAGGMIADLEKDSSIPTTNAPTSTFQFLHRFQKVESFKESTVHRMRQRSEWMDVPFRSAVEARKREIYNDHYSSITERDSSKVTTFQSSSSKSSHYKKQNLSIGPVSVEEARSDPGLRHRVAPAKSFREKMIRHVERKWAQMEEITLTESCDMKHIHDEFELLQERWDTIPSDRIKVEVTGAIQRQKV